MEAVRIVITTTQEILEKVAAFLDSVEVPMPVNISSVTKGGKTKVEVVLTWEDVVQLAPVMGNMALVLDSAKALAGSMALVERSIESISNQGGTKVFLNDEEIPAEELDDILDFSMEAKE